MRTRLRAVLNTGGAVRLIGPARFATNWEELGNLMERYPGSPAFVDPGFDGPRSPFAADLGSVDQDRWGSAPLVCYARLDPKEERRLATLGCFVEALLPNDEPPAIDAAILRSIDAQKNLRLLEGVERAAGPAACAVFGQALRLSVEPTAVRELAATLGVSERALQRRCATLAIPAPKTLLSLARIFTVERLLHWSRQSAGVVMRTVGLSDRSNYRRMVRTVLGNPPSAVRARGGTEYLSEVIVRRSFGARPPTRPMLLRS